jgi:hypothetical protein
MENPNTPDVTPQTRDTLLEQLNFLIDGARSNLMDMKASLAIDGKMLRQAYDLGATAHEENMDVRTPSWDSCIEVHVEMEEGGFSYNGDVNIEEDVIREAIKFNDHFMTDEQVDDILKS